MYAPATRIDGNPIQSGLESVSYLGPRYLRERSGDFTDSTLAAKLGAIPTSMLVLLPEHVSGVSIEGTQNGPNHFSIHLTEIPELAAGRENSRHNVQFGQLHIASERTIPITELVAVKYLNRVATPREFHAARKINREFGEDVAFQPIGFIRKPGTDEVGYLTRYEHGVVTFDNVLWNRKADPTLQEETLGLAGVALASLHGHNFIHGDAQAKNLARDSSQRLRYPDLEGAQTYDPTDPMSRIKRLQDIGDVFNPVYMPMTTPDQNKAFREAYLEQQAPNVHYIDGQDIDETIRQAQKEDIS